MKQLKYQLVIIIIILFCGSVCSQQEEKPDTLGIGGFNWFAYPYIFYTPETSLAFGAGGVVSFKFSNQSKLKPSSVTASGYYSINNQYDISVTPEIYFDQDRFKVWFMFDYGRVFDRFYGIGNNTPDLGNNKYFQKNFIFNLKILTEVFQKNVKLGAIYEYRYMDVADKLGNPFFVAGEITGSEGGTTSGIGIVATFDSRDNIFYPHSGGYYEFNVTSFQKSFGSDFNYNKYIIDLRQFIELAERHILALQSYFMTVTADPPFYDLALLGGDKLMRGYIKGRYRDRNYYVLQTEYRMPLIWRFRLVFFGGIGDVAPAISKFEINFIKAFYGAGIRFRLDELQKLDLRLDVGFGKATNGFYFSINQAF